MSHSKHSGHVNGIILTPLQEWSDSAKAKTFRAITRAGFNKKYFPNLNEIILANEPEAASLFVLKSIQQDEENTLLKVGLDQPY